MVEECSRASSAPEDRPKGEVLKSNVDTDQPAPRAQAPRRNVAVLPLVLGGVLLFVLGVGAALLVSSWAKPQAVSRPTPVAVPVPGAAAAGDGSLPDINGISCDTLEGTIVHIHMHLAIFVNGQEQPIPHGIRIGQPWQVSDSDEGPFVEDGSCFYWIHTHTDDGIVHIESPLPPVHARGFLCNLADAAERQPGRSGARTGHPVRQRTEVQRQSIRRAVAAARARAAGCGRRRATLSVRLSRRRLIDSPVRTLRRTGGCDARGARRARCGAAAQPRRAPHQGRGQSAN